MSTLDVARLPVFQGFGIQTPYGTLLGPASQVAAYVCSAGPPAGAGQDIAKNLVTTLSAALGRVRSGLGDVIYVLPGHSESVASATYFSSLVAGTKIIGLGYGTNQPTLRLTATTSQLAIAVADVVIQNMYLKLEGAVVAKAINVTGANCAFVGNRFLFGTDSTHVATIACEVGVGADGFRFIGNRLRSLYAGTDGVKVVGATPPVDLRFTDNYGICAADATNGIYNFTVASTEIQIERDVLYNKTASSTAAILFANVASDGYCADVRTFVKNSGGTTNQQGIVVAGSSVLVEMINCYVNDTKNTNGILSPAATT